MDTSHHVLLSLFFITALLRIWELRVAKRNKFLRENNSTKLTHSEPYFFLFFVLHISFLIFTPLEVFFFDRPFSFFFGCTALLIYAFCLVLRFHVISVLGTNWNTEVLSHPTPDTIVTSGIYSKIRHPNYLVVILELLSLSLFHGAWFSLVLFSGLNLLLLLKFRIPKEEEILFQNPKYKAHFQDKNRFFPF